MARLTRGGWVGWSIKSELVRPRPFDHWFDPDQSYQTARSLVENCSQSPPGPEKENVINKHMVLITVESSTSLKRDPPPKNIPYLTLCFTSLWPCRPIVQCCNAGDCERHRVVHESIVLLSLLLSFCLLWEELLLRLSLHNRVGARQVGTG